jgi:uncharacterized radical SAM superfamily Fe-S cluster-containing enzyme
MNTIEKGNVKFESSLEGVKGLISGMENKTGRTLGLPRTVESLCPECLSVIKANIFADGMDVKMEKTCPVHGTFNDIIYYDPKLYLKQDRFFFTEGRGIQNPLSGFTGNCPSDCGICSGHFSHTNLANIDLTNRCNLNCPICFANSNQAGFIYEPSFEEIEQMMRNLREMKPVACSAIQFAGGEPTVYPEFLRVIKKAVELGFSHIQVATNGIKIADDPSYAHKLREAGLQYVYLQFDGVSDDIYMQTRGKALLEKKLKVIEHCRQSGLRLLFVPTIVKGLNDHQIGDIIRLALDNIDVMTGISFQPLTFTGRVDESERLEKRVTMGHIAHYIQEQTGLIDVMEDWVPVSSVSPFSEIAQTLTGNPSVNCSSHHICASGNFLFVDKDKNATPFTRFIKYEKLLNQIIGLNNRASGKKWMLPYKLKTLSLLKKSLIKSKLPEGLGFMKFLNTLRGFADKEYIWNEKTSKKTYKTFWIAGMHFMDNYNYELERVKRCVIHYTAADGKIYPFCTYNSGHNFRVAVEAKHRKK